MLTVFDMDGVLIEERSSWRLLHRVFGTDNSNVVKKYREGKIDDLQFLNEDIRIWRERGVRERDIKTALEDVPLTSGIRECMDFFGSRGRVAIISGGIDTLAERIARYGVDYVFANGIEYRNGIPWKRILRVPIRNKESILKKLMEEMKLKKEDIVVVGDNVHDAGMMDMAGVAIAFNPKEGSGIEKHADFVVKRRDLKELIKIFE
ncbi:MAG TPA: HAD family hydrolase [Thermoplasmatales archaeon]|nr:HAD family hydrolase [Thermoplasmatales archaeon]